MAKPCKPNASKIKTEKEKRRNKHRR